jgi:hypothetical protein
MKYYLAERTARNNQFNPRFLLELISRFSVQLNLQRVATLAEIDDRDWLCPILLNNAYRVSRALSAQKGANIVYFDALDDAERRALATTNGMVTLDLVAETAFTRDEMLAGIHEGLAECGLAPRQLCIINGNMLSERLYGQYCDRQGIAADARARMIPFHGCLWLFVGHTQRASDDPELRANLDASRRALAGQRRGRTFTSFNGRLRPHRLHVVLFMLARGLIDKGYVSFLGYSNDAQMSEAHLRAMDGAMPYAADTSAHIAALMARLPLTLDVEGQGYSARTYKGVTEMHWASPDPHFYLDSYFSVVVDTTMERGMLFITPMSYKPIMNCHPFVYFGNAGALAELKQMGFQTFAPLIDESYDAVEDPRERLRLALGELDRLGKLSPKRLHDMYCELWPRLEHNYRRFWYELPTEFAAYWRREVLDRMFGETLVGTS